MRRAVIAHIEWLQRMFPEPWPCIPVGEAELFVEILQQLSERRRRVAHGARVRVFAEVTQVQALARGHQRLEKQVTIFVARVAIAATRLAQHAVESRVAGRTRELALIQAEHAHDAEWNRTLRHQAAEGHPTEQERL